MKIYAHSVFMENKINTVMKTKGIPKKQLKEKYFNDESGKVKFNTMKKLNSMLLVKRKKKDIHI